MKIRQWYIYKITSPSGRVYIGKTCNYKNRLLQYNHYATTKQQPRLWNSFEVVDTFFGDNEAAASKEMFWIRSYMSNVCKWRELNGLNLTDGGDGTSGYKHSRGTVEKMAARFRGKKLSDAHRKKISDSMRIRGNMKIGTKQTQDTKDKIRKAMIGRVVSEKTRKLMGEATKRRFAKASKTPKRPKKQRTTSPKLKKSIPTGWEWSLLARK